MSRMMFAIAIAAISIGCKQKPADDVGASSGRSTAMGTEGDMGSAMGTTMHDGAPSTMATDAPAPKTPDELAKRYDEYIATKPAHDPQLVLISGNTIVAIVLVADPKPHLLGQVVEMDSQGKVTSDTAFFDPTFARAATKLPTKLALIAKNDDIERANLATLAKLMEKSDGSLIADDVVWSVQTRPKDLSKQEILAATDLRYTLEKSWAAGEYVASIERVVGTATADSPDKTIKKGDKIDRRLAVHRFANGKLAQVWVFPQP